jgi:hypothetical protein
MPPVLIKNIFRIYTATFRNWRSAKKSKIVAAVIGLLFLPSMIVVQTFNMFEMWLYLPQGSELMFHFVSASMLGVMFLLFLTGLPVAMHHFFLAKDLPMLLSFPLQARQVYSQKFFETAMSNFGMFVLLGFPVLLSTILAIQFNLLLLIVVILASVLFICIISGISILVSLLCARFFSIKKVRRYATLVLGLFIVLAWASFQFIRMSRLDPSSIDFDPAAIESFSSLAASSSFFALPSDWIVELIRSFYGGDWFHLLVYVSALFITAVFLLIVSTRWREALDKFDAKIESSSRKSPTINPEFKSPRLRFYTAIFLKDMRLVFRDTRFFQSNLILVAMLVISPFLTDVNESNVPGIYDILSPYIPLTILMLIVSSAMGRQNLPMERLAYQYVKLSPVNVHEYLVVKSMRPIFLVVLASSIAFLISAGRFGTPVGWIAAIIGVTWLLAVGGASLGQAFGAIAGKFDWTDPRYMNDMSWTLISTFIHLLYGVIGLGILATGFYLNQRAVAFVLFFFYVGLVFRVSTRIAAKRLQKLDWVY